MSKEFFEITSPRHMLEKAKRDIDKMKEDLDTDSIFNFFVTAYHVMDYVKAQGSVDKSAIDAMYADPDFEMCNFICNKGKHLQLQKKIKGKKVDIPDTYEIKHTPAALFGSTGFNEAMFNESESFVILDGSHKVDVIVLGESLIYKWETFFSNNKL